MNFTAKIALGVLAAGALGGLYYWDIKRSETQELVSRDEKKALPFDPTEIIEFSLATAKGAVRLARPDKDAKWMFQEPASSVSVDQDAAKRFLSSVAELSIMQLLDGTEKVIQGDESSLKVYGLDTPQTMFSAKDAAGKTHSLKLGSDTGIGKSEDGTGASMAYYAASSARDTLIMLRSSTLSTFEKGFADFRTKAVATFSTAEVEVFELQHAQGNTIRVEKKDGKWLITQPREVDADENNVSLYLDRVSGMKADEVIEPLALDSATRIKLGLNPPVAILKVFGAEGKTLQTLEMGKETDKRLAISMADGGTGILTTRKWDEIVPNFLYLRDKLVLRGVAFDEIRRIVTASGRSYERDAKDWYSVEADAKAPEKSASVEGTPTEAKREANRDVGDFFSDWEFMTASDVLDDASPLDAGKYGFDKPQATFIFELAEGKGEPIKIVAGRGVPNDDKLIYIKRTSQDVVFVVEKYWLDTFKKIDSSQTKEDKEEEVTAGDTPANL